MKEPKDWSKVFGDSEQFEKYRRNFVKKTLRRSSLMWPARTEALRKARIERGFYTCNMCKESFGYKAVQVDHILPVVDITTDMYAVPDWNTYITRLLVKPEELQVLCEQCHESKSMTESTLRAIHRKKLKIKKKVVDNKRKKR